MSDIEQAWLTNPSRRVALAHMAGLMAASPVAAAVAQTDPRPLGEHRRALTLAEMQTAFDFEPVFFGNVLLPIYDYTAHGDGSEFTLRRNRQAFDWVDIVPGRAPLPASQVDLSSELLGVQMKFPIFVAPTAAMKPLHPDGEIGMYKAAIAASNTPMMLSINTSTPVAQVAPAASGTLWGQFYPAESLAGTQRLIDGYQNVGVNGIIVTVDQQASYYERTQQDRNFGGTVRAPVGGAGGGGAATAATRTAAAVEGAAASPTPPPTPAAPTGSARYRINGGRLWYTWSYIDDVRKMVKGPLIMKGILEAADARLAIEHGVDAIIVSNHGGRSMDYGPSSLEVLPEIVAAVNGRIPIIFDSGIRRGADIFKALALGANAVMLGRTTRWGLAAYGIPGARRVIEILQQELIQTAAAAGCAKLADIGKAKVRTHFV